MLHAEFLRMSCLLYHSIINHVNIFPTWAQDQFKYQYVGAIEMVIESILSPLIPIGTEIISKGVMAAPRVCSDGLSPPLWLPHPPLLTILQTYCSFSLSGIKSSPYRCVFPTSSWLSTLIWLSFQNTRPTWSLTDAIGQPCHFLIHHLIFQCSVMSLGV